MSDVQEIDINEVMDSEEVKELLLFSVSQYATTFDMIGAIINSNDALDDPEATLNAVLTMMKACVNLIQQEVESKVDQYIDSEGLN